MSYTGLDPNGMRAAMNPGKFTKSRDRQGRSSIAYNTRATLCCDSLWRAVQVCSRRAGGIKVCKQGCLVCTVERLRLLEINGYLRVTLFFYEGTI